MKTIFSYWLGFALFLSGVYRSEQDELPLPPPVISDSETTFPICPKLCGINEFAVDVENEVLCGKLVQLGERCNNLKICSPAFSVCTSGRCRCLPRFTARNNQCIPQSISCPGLTINSNTQRIRPCSIFFDNCPPPGCPYGSNCPTGLGNATLPDIIVDPSTERYGTKGVGCMPLGHSPVFTVAKNATKRFRLKRQRPVEPEPMSMVTESCPRDHYCYIHASYALNSCKTKAFGHCCPHSCPVGEPHPTASCEYGARVSCSHQAGYYCRRSYLTEDTVRGFGKKVDRHFLATCCPSHCPANMVALSRGQCMPRARFGQSCWESEQCPQTSSCINGICSCGDEGMLVANGTTLNGLKTKMILGRDGFKCVSTRINGAPLGNSCPQFIDICSADHSICDGENCVCSCGYQEKNGKCVAKGRSRPVVCLDKVNDCRERKIQGKCESYVNWMKENCAKTCYFCQAT